MKRNSLRIFVCFAILVLSFLLWKRFNQKLNSLAIKSEIYNGIAIVPKTRTWENASLTDFSLYNDIKDSLLRPISLKQFNDTLYISDYGDMKIKRFDRSGKYIDNYGKGIGRGPEDFTQIMDFTTSGNKLYVLDLNTMMVKVFDKNSKNLISTISIKYHAMRIASVNGFQVINSLSDHDLFNIYGDNDSLITSFGELVEDQVMNPLSLQGELAITNSDSVFIYVPNYASYIFYFTLNGELIKTIQTIDKFEFPGTNKSSTKDNTVRLNAPNPNQKTQGIASTSKYLFIQNTKRSLKSSSGKIIEPTYSFLDIYTISGSEYITSVKLPVVVSGITVIKNKLYLISSEKNTVFAYLLPEF